MAINLSKLGNITPFDINTSIISSDPAQTIANLTTNNHNLTFGYFALIYLTLIFLSLLYEFYRNDGDFKLDSIRAIIKSSGWTALIGIVLIASELIFDFIPVVWFLVIFLIAGIITIFVKKKNL